MTEVTCSVYNSCSLYVWADIMDVSVSFMYVAHPITLYILYRRI